ncbi:HE65 [Alphabaculovirus altermyunipunctae]|uniref:HE65 n=1 Tax=Mythimna unipuncta nucleopolyhedrovirus TaxID=447897 RepID=A0A346TPI9_9ABAC|nr:HE65 [Mythimna unipuncta nucleopolyhedrovirus]AXU41499.1 HE65 [Mythimna unipuncta nucleopolyhedrovirus]
MVYIKLDIGSHAKGYSTENSDRDYVIFTKCSPEDFLCYINDRNHLVNVHGKTEEGDDCTYVDLYKGLHGIYTGKYYYLGVFARESDVVDKNGLPNTELFVFIRQLARLRMFNILQTMLRYKVKRSANEDAKQLLAIMYNVAYVDRWLASEKFPEHNYLPQLLNGNAERIQLYDTLMKLRHTNGPVDEEHKTYIHEWQESLKNKLSRIPPLPERYDVLKTIVKYALNDSGPVLPAGLNITRLLYPSITRLTSSTSASLWNKIVCVQEKLDGCNFRIIVNGENRITYGSRNTYREYSNFMNFYRIRSQLEASARRLQKVTGYNSFVVYGELVGWKDDDRQIPINQIHYSAQKEPIEFYAYDIKRYDDGQEEDIEFELAQNFLDSCGRFKTIPYECMPYEDFVSNGIVFKSLLFPDHDQEAVEGYILRCDELKYKITKDYDPNIVVANCNALKLITKQFVCDVMRRHGAEDAIDASNFDQLVLHCYRAVEDLDRSLILSPKKVFSKIFGILCVRAGVTHNEYSQRLRTFCSSIEQNSNNQIY